LHNRYTPPFCPPLSEADLTSSTRQSTTADSHKTNDGACEKKNLAQIGTYSHQSVPNNFLNQISWFSIAGRDTRAKKLAEKHKGVRHARRRSQVAIATNFFLLYEIVDGFTRSAVTSSLTAVNTHG
jgi:hypothetical protein